VEVIVLGGGVAKTPGLIARVAARTAQLGAGYLPGHARQRIEAPLHGENAGITGALMLAERLG
jgi:fructokinase